MKKNDDDNREERVGRKKVLKSTLREDTTSIVHAQRGTFHVNEYPYLGYTITTAIDDTQMGAVMSIANGF